MKKQLAIVQIVGILVIASTAQARENIYYFHNDHLGTPQVMTDQSGRKVWQAEIEPFGAAAVDGDADMDGIPVVNNIRFPGQYYDEETSLHYNYHRDYDPMTGRYLEADPIGIQSGTNHLYAYALNNPLSNIDPMGLEITLCLSPMEGIPAWLGKHGSISANCGIYGFHPTGSVWGSPGIVRDNSNRAGLQCGNRTPMTRCADEECVCRKISSSQINPGFYSWNGFNCHSWTRKIIVECQKKDCCEE